MRSLEEIKAAAKAAREKAAAVLTPEQSEYAAALADEQDAVAALAAEQAKARAIAMAEHLAAAKAVAGTEYLVGAVDVVAMFPVDAQPPAEHLPPGGFVIVRSPKPEDAAWFTREIEAKKLTLEVLSGKLACKCLVDPDPESAEGARFASFVAKYTNAGVQIGGRCGELGGAKTAADKRGGA